MKKLITILSLLLFLFAPTLSAQNSLYENGADTSLHSMEFCSDELSCATATMKCCTTSSAFYFQTIDIPEQFRILQRSTYVYINQHPLLGLQSVRFRPPIVQS